MMPPSTACWTVGRRIWKTRTENITLMSNLILELGWLGRRTLQCECRMFEKLKKGIAPILAEHSERSTLWPSFHPVRRCHKPWHTGWRRTAVAIVLCSSSIPSSARIIKKNTRFTTGKQKWSAADVSRIQGMQKVFVWHEHLIKKITICYSTVSMRIMIRVL